MAKKTGDRATGDKASPADLAPVPVQARGGRGHRALEEPQKERAFLELLELLHQKVAEEDGEHRALAEVYYQRWAQIINGLHNEFRTLWNLFGTVEEKVMGWYRTAPHGGEFDYLAVTKGGYSFAAGVEKNNNRGAPYPDKWLVVSFGWGSGPYPGIGDERPLGRQGRIDAELHGLARCKCGDGEEQLKAARNLYERALGTSLVISLNHEKLGQIHKKVDPSLIAGRSLRDLCRGLFAALNKDELDELRQVLPGAMDGSRALEGQGEKTLAQRTAKLLGLK